MKESRVIIWVLATTLLIFAVLSLVWKEDSALPQDNILPWQSYVNPAGQTVAFNLTIGESRLVDAMRLFNTAEVEVSLFEQEGSAPNLEAFFVKVRLEGIDAKVILNLDVDHQVVEQLAQHIDDVVIMPSGAKKAEFNPMADRIVSSRVIRVITFIPRTDLDTQVLTQRFGEPQRVEMGEEGQQYWHYPAKGLRIIVDDEGQEIFEYSNLEAKQ